MRRREPGRSCGSSECGRRSDGEGDADGAAPAVVAEGVRMPPFERSALLIDLQLVLRRVPAETLRAMLKPRQPGDLEPERIAASAVLDYLEQCGWRFQTSAPPPIPPAA